MVGQIRNDIYLSHTLIISAIDRGGLGPIGEHYNIIGIRWGPGPAGKHLFSGIKAARVIQSLSEDYGLDVSTIHGLGFR